MNPPSPNLTSMKSIDLAAEQDISIDGLTVFPSTREGPCLVHSLL
jgi:hypothetical protein